MATDLRLVVKSHEIMPRRLELVKTAKWVSADSPPPGKPQLWTDDAVVVTNFWNVYKLAFMHGANGGVWQHPGAFEVDEHVEWWTPLPE